MKEERMRVLKLVEEGKITVDDAAKLLEALMASKSPEEDCFQENREFEKKFAAFAKNAENFAKDCGDKVGDAFREVEPKLRKVSKVVLVKTAAIIDDLSKALNESLQNMDVADCECECDCCCDDEPCEEEACECGCGCDCDDTPKEN